MGNRESERPRDPSIPDSRFPIPDDWWAEYFDAQYLLEYSPIFDLARDRREVARLVEILGLPAGSRVLDVPCGQGRHAHLLAEAGYDVDGLDLSRELLARAKDRSSATRAETCDGCQRDGPAGSMRW